VTLNLHQTRALVASQLRLDLRHPKSGATQTSRAVLTVSSYFFSSLVLALSLAERGAGLPELLFAGLSFSAVLAAFGVAGSYDDLMGRPRDHARMLTYPVSETTLYVARLVNVGIFGVMMSVSAALPLAGAAWLMHGAPAGLMAGAALTAMMLGVTFAVLGCVWLLTLAAPLRIQKAALSATRAALIGALVLGYQWVATQPSLVAEAPWWPAHWMTTAVLGGSPAGWMALAGAAALLALAYGALFPRFYVRVLQRTAAAEALRQPGGRARHAPNALERLAVAGAEARAAFGMAVAALRGDRLVRGRVWPAALLALVFAAFGWWADGLGDLFVYGAHNVLLEPAIQMHLSVLTILLFAAQAAMQGMQVSDNPEASWSFDVLPVRSGRMLQVGAQQAVLFRVLVPLHVVLAVMLAFSMPITHALLHAAFWLAGCALITRLQAVSRNRVPLSQRSDRFSAGERFVPLLLAIPMALVMLILQGLTFTDPAGATLLVVGLFVVHAALARLAAGRVASGVPAAAAPPVALERA
jgi:hypothetical protein